MKIACIACGEPATIIDHDFQTVTIIGVSFEVVDLDVECDKCEYTISQSLRTTGLTEEQVLAHPRHYTQLP